MLVTARRLSFLWGGILLWLLPGCTPAAHKPPQAEDSLPSRSVSDPAPAADDPRPVAEPTPAEISQAAYGQELPWAELLISVRRNAQRAQELFAQGHLDEGRKAFHECLARLNESPFDLAAHPQLKRAYLRVLAELNEAEIHASDRQTEGDIVEELEALSRESTPLDEIADLNLFALEVDPKLAELVNQELLQARFDLPVVLNDQVLRMLDFYQNRGRAIMEKGLARVGRYRNVFESAFEEAGLPRDLIYLSHVESLFNPLAYSRARAKGLWQFTAGTARLYDLQIDWWVDERSDIVKSTRSASRYLKDLYDKFGDWYLVLAAYNGGPGRIERILRRNGPIDYWEMTRRRLLPRETRNFVPSILAAIIIFNNPERFGFEVQPDPPLSFEEISLDDQVDLHTLARLAGVDREEIAALNPELRRGLTPFERPDYRLKVPEGLAESISKELAALPPQEKIRMVHHRVRSGETLSAIASRYGTSVTAIAQFNRIRNIHRISLNQDLMIPLAGAAPPPPRRAASVPQSIPRNGTHVVQSGDSLYRIAHLYGVRLQELLRWNNLSKTAVIYPGQQIRISPNP